MTLNRDVIEFANRLADASGAVLRRRFRQPFPISIKPDQSPVTAIDQEVETRLRGMIAAAYPDHGIIGEEYGADRPEAEHVWVLDPIDGTKSFIAGRPTFGTLIALCRQGRPVLGIIDHPVLGTGERWVGATGHPTLHDGAIVHVRSCPRIAAASMFGSSPHSSRPENERAFDRVRRAAGQVLYSADCYAYGLIASGHADLCIEFGLGIYDFLAAVPVLEGAGGIITDWSGAPLTIGSGENVVAAGDRTLHRAALAMLAQPETAPATP
ncbi:MAG TPA: inositol monophosphatase family protein [Hypericibacter adhaerens]|jgi:histidinol phosphatase-like enzyme (inositol monophosphatase family)|uniref:Histidinol-phosphatase n=1 Tax=Hypericibacter adhaerens TaxID=2602016 RepID=A0A5J6N7V2_9PROT|nr:inositol monophosphatase family protein [Hypericibacter adhaerens]QEX23216.1 histidinol-phosphatase [Hypericibacter adhaerens]HWA44621.1 inositol monophosphatase family protein [Hypericibacter adhaerens]